MCYCECGKEKKCWKINKVEAKQNKANNRNHIQFHALCDFNFEGEHNRDDDDQRKINGKQWSPLVYTQISGHAAEFSILSPGKNHNDDAYVIRFFVFIVREKEH